MVYIAPLKALVRERIIDWKIKLEKKLKKSVVELTGMRQIILLIYYIIYKV